MNVYDFSKEESFPRTYLVYDTQEKDFFRYIIYNGDYSYKKEFYMSMLTPINSRATAPKLRSNIIFISKDFSQNNHHTIIFCLYALFFNRLKHDSSCFKLSYYYHATIILSAYTFTHIADNMIFIFY